MSGGVQRVNYFTGKLLTAEDLQSEQAYHVGRARRHNVAFHAAGVVEGLGVTCTGGKVVVAAGLALDCVGREISVPEEAKLGLPGVRGPRVYVLLGYAERGVDFVPVADPAGEGGTVSVPSQIEETYALSVGPAPVKHARRGKGWRACESEHGVPLARLVREKGRWRVDRGYRRPEAG
jgi:hypothetical protein